MSLVGRSRVRLEESGELVDSVESDLSGLAQSSERLREEKAMSERSPDEQTRKYALKLPELEVQAQGKLENQEFDFRAFFEEAKARFAEAYREKLKQELRTQSNITNEQCVSLPSLVALSC